MNIRGAENKLLSLMPASLRPKEAIKYKQVESKILSYGSYVDKYNHTQKIKSLSLGKHSYFFWIKTELYMPLLKDLVYIPALNCQQEAG